MTIYSVILCGGAGQRLWPLSRASFPKQFIKNSSGKSLFQQTLQRCKLLGSKNIIVSNNEYRFIVKQQINEINAKNCTILIEPVSKNTAPAIIAAANFVSNLDANGIIAVFPSDHNIVEDVDFNSTVIKATELLKCNEVICFGVVPKSPQTAYGYVKVNKATKQKETGHEIFEAEKFIEKPNLVRAIEFLNDGNYFWNAGIFTFYAKDFLELAKVENEEMITSVNKAFINSSSDIGFLRLCPKQWEQIEPESFDYAFMEKLTSIRCIRLDTHWTDLGDWNSYAASVKKDVHGNQLVGESIQLDCTDSILWNDDENTVLSGLGLNGLIAVSTGDAILVADKNKSQEIKLVVNELKRKTIRQGETSQIDHRPWGWFKVLASGKNYKTKLLTVFPRAQLSLQSHLYRSEHWVVLKGQAKVIKNDKIIVLEENQSIYIEAGDKHQLINETSSEIEIIEIQTGSYFGEDDIIRYSDIYEREL